MLNITQGSLNEPSPRLATELPLGKANPLSVLPAGNRTAANKWVVLAILVQFPFATRPWALPVLVALYRSPQENQQRGRPHKTPAQLLHLLVRLLRRWFPDRQFLLAGDGGYGSHETAALTRRQAGKVHVVSKFPANANLYEPPPPYAGHGRPRVKGKKLPSPQEVVAQTQPTRLREL